MPPSLQIQNPGQKSPDERHVIAFDIDGTWTLHPTAWLSVYLIMQSAGMRPIIVTGRPHPQDKLRRLLIPEDATIIVSGDLFKEEAARRAGYTVAVWIDDMPGVIQNCRILTGTID